MADDPCVSFQDIKSRLKKQLMVAIETLVPYNSENAGEKSKAARETIQQAGEDALKELDKLYGERQNKRGN